MYHLKGKTASVLICSEGSTILVRIYSTRMHVYTLNSGIVICTVE